MPVHTHTHTRKHIHTQYSPSCPIMMCSIILPCPRHSAHFSAFLLNHSIVYATQYHRASKLGAKHVTIHLNLPDSWLKWFVHSFVCMNPSQGIYNGKGAALVNCCYNSIQSLSPHLLKSYTQSWKTQRLTKTNCCYDVFTAPLVSIPLSFVKSNIRLSF